MICEIQKWFIFFFFHTKLFFLHLLTLTPLAVILSVILSGKEHCTASLQLHACQYTCADLPSGSFQTGCSMSLSIWAEPQIFICLWDLYFFKFVQNWFRITETESLSLLVLGNRDKKLFSLLCSLGIYFASTTARNEYFECNMLPGEFCDIMSGVISDMRKWILKNTTRRNI